MRIQKSFLLLVAILCFHLANSAQKKEKKKPSLVCSFLRNLKTCSLLNSKSKNMLGKIDVDLQTCDNGNNRVQLTITTTRRKPGTYEVTFSGADTSKQISKTRVTVSASSLSPTLGFIEGKSIAQDIQNYDRILGSIVQVNFDKVPLILDSCQIDFCLSEKSTQMYCYLDSPIYYDYAKYAVREETIAPDINNDDSVTSIVTDIAPPATSLPSEVPSKVIGIMPPVPNVYSMSAMLIECGERGSIVGTIWYNNYYYANDLYVPYKRLFPPITLNLVVIHQGGKAKASVLIHPSSPDSSKSFKFAKILLPINEIVIYNDKTGISIGTCGTAERNYINQPPIG
ncbi:uncharacterized protein LOC132194327 isoform X2 [Neocloeon triangulifer]|uniref:uncharacterized protein LOC132194327 isoform X2 n=1 Tax=Neocloeon triangulifer TaxID=2078957 RepID=UPI00286F8782|nr:uncharacterized protein LOC132194327 isoform X2 [Neocloeon triangulifer]